MVLGALIVLCTWISVVANLVVPRGLRSRYTRLIRDVVRGPFQARGRPLPHLRDQGPDPGLVRAAVDPGDAAELAGAVRGGLRLRAGRGRRDQRRQGHGGVRFVGVHPRLPEQLGQPADLHRLLRRGDRPGDDRPAGRLPAGDVQRVLAAGGRGDDAAGAGGLAGLGPGDPDAARAAARPDQPASGALPGLGTLGLAGRGEPHQLSGADPLPLAARDPQLADRAARRDGRGGARTRAQPVPSRADAAGGDDAADLDADDAARRVQLPARDRGRRGHRVRRRPGSGRRDRADLRGVRAGPGHAALRGLPDGARAARRPGRTSAAGG